MILNLRKLLDNVLDIGAENEKKNIEESKKYVF